MEKDNIDDDKMLAKIQKYTDELEAATTYNSACCYELGIVIY